MQDDSVRRAGMLFGVLLGITAGLFSLAAPLFVGVSTGSGVLALLTLALTWMLYAILACRLSDEGFDTAWPGLVGLTFPLSAAAFIVPQWPEVAPQLRWVPLMALAIGAVGLVTGVVIERRLPRRPPSRQPANGPTEMPAPFDSGIRGVIGWLLLTLWLGAWAVQHMISSLGDSSVRSSLMAGVMGSLSVLAAFRTWTSAKEWRARRRRRR